MVPNPPMTSSLEAALDSLLREFGCDGGTIHVLDADNGVLRLAAHRGIPEFVLLRVRDVPIGKGMAGLAAKRREPVQACDLQTDSCGAAKPTVGESNMAGSIAAPMIAPDGSLKGTIGISKAAPYDFTADECERLMHAGTRIAEQLAAVE